MSTETILREKIATCTRILAMQQLLGLFGHISAYDPEKKRVYFSPSMGADKAEVRDDQVVVSDLDGQLVEGHQRPPLEWPIHTALHMRRKNALAIAHLHAPSATIFSFLEKEFAPVTLQGSIFDGGVPVFDEPSLVTSEALGEKLADVVQDRPAAFMRGHGVVVVAPDVEQMLYLALILEDEATKHMQAASLGKYRCISHDEAERFGAGVEFGRRADRTWKYFCTCEKKWDRNPGTGRAPFV